MNTALIAQAAKVMSSRPKSRSLFGVPKKGDKTANKVTLSEDGTAWIEMANGHRALVDAEDLPLLAGHHWCAARNENRFYARAHFYRPDGQRRIVNMHTLLINGCLPGKAAHVDHWNGNGLDNRRDNLRATDCSHNHMNKGLTKANKSGFKGVSFEKRCPNHPWRALIYGKTFGKRDLGHFGMPEEAARAYDAAARVLHGEFAQLNFPNEPTPEGWLIPSETKRISAAGYRGVKCRNGRFRAIFQGKHLGTFDTPVEAASVYDQAARAAYGTKAIVNFQVSA